MDNISYTVQEAVAVIHLNRGVTNAIQHALVVELGELLTQAIKDPQVHSLALSSSNTKFFSIGFDIPSLYDLPQHDFRVFYQAFNRLCLALYSCPKPTIAAMPGHAIAGGCILTLCCDYRMIADGRKLMSLNEIKLGVPVPYPADRILREVVGNRQASAMMESGAFYSPEESLGLGLVDQILSIEELEKTAIEKIREIGSFPQAAFALIKKNRVEPVIQHIAQVLAEKEAAFIERWYSPEARELIAEARTKF